MADAKVHFLSGSWQGGWTNYGICYTPVSPDTSTKDRQKVTCKKCLLRLAKEAAR